MLMEKRGNSVLVYKDHTFHVLVAAVAPIVNAKVVAAVEDPVSTYTETLK
jgi:hypothetical protein